MASVCLLLEESCSLVISPHLYRAWYCPKERKNHGKVHIFLWNMSILIFRPCKKVHFVCMGLRFQIRLQQEGQASRERLTRKWRMLSYPLSHASRARVYPSDYVFFAVTSVTRGEERDGKRQKVGSGRQWKTCILGTHNEQNKDCDRDCLSKSTKHQMQQNELQLITSNCDRCDSKKHKTLVYTRMRAHVRDIIIVNFIYTISLFVVTLFLTIC